MRDLQVKEIKVKYELPTIVYELTPLKQQVEQIKELYSGWVVEENDLPQAKKLTAQLNKAVKDISRKRIDIAKAIKEPLTTFEEEIKAITSEVEEIANSIKDQMNDYETQRKENKKQEILDLVGWCDYMSFNEQWLNKTFAIADIEKDLERQRTIFENNSLLITTTCKGVGLSPDKYLQMLVDKKAIQDIVDLINNDVEVKQEYQEQTPTEITETPITVADSQDTTLLSFTLKITGTKTQLKSLRAYITELGLTYEKL